MTRSAPEGSRNKARALLREPRATRQAHTVRVRGPARSLPARSGPTRHHGPESALRRRRGPVSGRCSAQAPGLRWSGEAVPRTGVCPGRAAGQARRSGRAMVAHGLGPSLSGHGPGASRRSWSELGVLRCRARRWQVRMRFSPAAADSEPSRSRLEFARKRRPGRDSAFAGRPRTRLLWRQGPGLTVLVREGRGAGAPGSRGAAKKVEGLSS